jgi:palmitoyltransferase
MSRPSSSGSSLASSFTNAPPNQPSAKSSAAAPMLDKNEVEMGMLSGSTARNDSDAVDDDADGDSNDIMHLARVGDIPGMERLFESGAYDATHADSEEITSLHVCCHLSAHAYRPSVLHMLIKFSGQPSTINMQCASSSSSTAPP